MKALRRIPILRALYRHYLDLTKPAPLVEFKDYDAYWQARIRDGRRGRVLDRHRIVTDLIEDGDRVLDVGCGEGAFLRFLGANRPNCKLLGADIAETAIAELRKEGLDGIRLDYSRPLAEQVSGAWDVVVLMEVIEHVVDAEDLMRQVLALHPKRVVVTIPNVGCLKHRLRLMFGGRFPIASIVYHMKEHVRFWTVTDFREWADHLGLKVGSYYGQVDRGDGMVRWLTRRLPGLFADQLVYVLVPKQSNVGG
ncbi:MAG TPA: methionine biosynthesis protein MetW [Xanthomonadaceae bacterium]|nr:methionine biosynthesis protein MetW [Xanthomonadaceae bacterium]